MFLEFKDNELESPDMGIGATWICLWCANCTTECGECTAACANNCRRGCGGGNVFPCPCGDSCQNGANSCASCTGKSRWGSANDEVLYMRGGETMFLEFKDNELDSTDEGMNPTGLCLWCANCTFSCGECSAACARTCWGGCGGGSLLGCGCGDDCTGGANSCASCTRQSR